MPTIRKQKYILNIDNNYWRVKIRTNLYESINKCFSFEKYGGKIHALNAAVDWRDGMLARYGLIERLDYKKSPDRFKARSNWPIIGIYKNYNKSTKRYNWIARCGINGQVKKKGFSIDLYGECQAFRLACEYRRANAGKLIVINRHLMPCPIRRPKKHK